MLFKKIDASSGDSVSSGFSFFRVPPTDVSLSNSDYKEILTLNPVSDPPFHFKIYPGSSFVDLNKSFFVTEMKMQKKVGGGIWENTVAADNASVMQGIGMNFIKNQKISISGRLVYNSNSLQAYKNYLDVQLSFGSDVKNSYLALTGYYEDPTDQHSGDGFDARRDLFTDGKTAQFITKINADLFNQDRYFLNNTEMDIEIQPHDSDFMIVAPNAPVGTEFRLIITNIRLYVKFLNATDGLSLSIARLVDKQPVRYPLKASCLKTHFLEAGRAEANVNIFTEQIPTNILCMLVPMENYNGSRTTSPFVAKPFDIQDIRMLWNGLQSPSVPYNLNFGQGLVARAFHDLYENSGLAWSPYTNGITLKKFKDGWTFFNFNLSANLENNPNFSLIREGTTSMYLRFRTVIPAGGVQVIIYATYDSLLNLDRNRTVTTDVTV